MNTASGDRNLLFGILALQMDFINRDALVAAMHAWVLHKAKPLSQILVEQDALSAARRALLEPLVQEHIQQHGGDAGQSLAAVSSVGSARDMLKQIADPDVQASLVNLRTTDPNLTKYPSAGDASAVGRRFLILRPHAEGGLGKVSVALDGELNREVALKEIHEQYADHSESRSRFLLEAEITGGLEHPSIVPVYGLGKYEDGRPFYAMRFIKGDSLKEAVERFHKTKGPINAGKRALELRQLLGRFNDVCDAIAYAHSRGVLHRDLKPGNVMLGKYGETLVVDWGLAKPAGAAANKADDAESPLQPSSADGSAPTQMGSAIGTPQFMPPEQAAGRLDQMGPASDVYSLGATLYCLLTGKPPFTDRDVGVVLQKVQRGDFPPPRQIRREIPPALEAICLKAMALRPADRYPTARALAGDIEKWLADEPVSAYREPWRVRAGRWVRRHQIMTAATAAGLLVALLAGGAGVSILERQSLETRRAVEIGIGEVERLQYEARWDEARAVLDQVKIRLGESGPGDLKAELDRKQGELGLVERLDAIRLRRAALQDGPLSFKKADQNYLEAFRKAGMEEPGGDVPLAAAWVQHSGVSEVIIAALDDWVACSQQKERRAWLLEVARRADPDPWRDRVRDVATWGDAAALSTLAESPEAAKQSPQLLDAIGVQLGRLGGNQEKFLRGAQARHPEDFAINFDLGNVLAHKYSPEAVGFCRAAITLRPHAAAVYNSLAIALFNLHINLHKAEELEEAIAAERKATDIDPGDAPAHANLGLFLTAQGKWDEAVVEMRKSIELDPNLVRQHNDLGMALKGQGKREEAATEYRLAIQLDPKDWEAHNGLGGVLSDEGKLEAAAAEYRISIGLNAKEVAPRHNLGEILLRLGMVDEAVSEYRASLGFSSRDAETHCRLGQILAGCGKLKEAADECLKAVKLNPKDARSFVALGNVLRDQGEREKAASAYLMAIQLGPKLADAYNGLGNVLRDQGKREEAAAEYRDAIGLDPKNAQSFNDLGNVLGEEGKQDQAAAVFRKAIELDPKLASAHNGLGNVLYSKGKREEAAAEYRRAIELDPKDAIAYSNLGNVMYSQGRFEEAAAAYRLAQGLVDALPAGNSLRELIPKRLRKIEQMLTLEKRLPGILRGVEKPVNADEQIRLGRLCYLKKDYADSARFYKDAFAVQPALGDELKSSRRYNAACAASLAVAGKGQDANKANEKELDRLRKQALDWLRADLALWGKQAESGAPQALAKVLANLRHWQEDSDLSSVRDPAALDKLPEAERAEWKKLWAEVADLLKKSGESGKN